MLGHEVWRVGCCSSFILVVVMFRFLLILGASLVALVNGTLPSEGKGDIPTMRQQKLQSDGLAQRPRHMTDCRSRKRKAGLIGMGDCAQTVGNRTIIPRSKHDASRQRRQEEQHSWCLKLTRRCLQWQSESWKERRHRDSDSTRLDSTRKKR